MTNTGHILSFDGTKTTDKWDYDTTNLGNLVELADIYNDGINRIISGKTVFVH